MRLAVITVALVTAGSLVYAEVMPIQAAQKSLKIVVLEGEDAVNIIQQRTAVAPVVEVRDDNDLPVAGVLVRFRTNGRNAVFVGGVLQLTLTTDAAGRAAATGLQALTEGTHQIEVSAEYQGLKATRTITQSNFATAAQAAKAGRANPTAAGAAVAAGGGGLSKAAIIGLAGAAGAGALVAVAAGGNDAPVASKPPAPPVVTNTAPALGGLTPSRSIALLGTEIAFSAQATDANNDSLTYAWAFGDGVTSTESAPRHTYTSAGTFTARLTVSDGKDSATQETAITIKSLTGSFVADALFFINDPGRPERSVPARVTLTLTQSGTAITGSVVQQLPPNELQSGTGTVTGSVNKTAPTIALVGRFTQVAGGFTFNDLVLSLEPGPDVDTLTGASTRQSFTFRRQ
jgi:hypothetical protein